MRVSSSSYAHDVFFSADDHRRFLLPPSLLCRFPSLFLDKGVGGGNFQVHCKLCDKFFHGSYTRVRAHLLKIPRQGIGFCKKLTQAKLIDMLKLDNEATIMIEKSKTETTPLPPLSSESPTADHKKRKTCGALENAFNMQGRETLDYEIARMFYSFGLSFHFAINPHFKKAFAYACNNFISGYQPPGYSKLRTTLLENERRHVEKLLEPIRTSLSQKGVTIVSDGWSDPQRRPLINFMIVTESVPMFLKVVDCSDEVKDKYFIAKKIREVIIEVRPSNVVQVVTNNAHVCRAASLIIESEFPSIYWTPCVVHTLNLALKNICAAKNTERNNTVYEECSWITKIAKDAMLIKNFIMCHSMRLSIFHSFNSLKLLSISPTRFASTIVMLKRFRELKKRASRDGH
ncbi:uncharacterized protein LOC130712832 [Lotus japonicus]|uniref:uncharacterized protein LOC130712832 n=1 Tax=Lotus japonicus TaxID=34305 RepID=UPI00258FD996|nr:uncharacterized protein LOC130712832 [Lotus japonicus]